MELIYYYKKKENYNLKMNHLLKEKNKIKKNEKLERNEIKENILINERPNSEKKSFCLYCNFMKIFDVWYDLRIKLRYYF